MCTMSSCKWDGATCSGAPADLTFEFLREKHEQCNDPLDICSNKEKTQLDCEKDHCESEFDGYDEQLFSYKSDKGDVTIPKGYFCFNKFEINQEYKPVYYWNRTEPVKEAGEAHDSAKAEPRSEMMFLEEYYHQKKNQNKYTFNRRWNHFDDQNLYQSKHDNEFHLLFSAQKPKFINIGWINTKERKVSEASNF